MFGLLLVLVVLLYIPIAAIGGLVALFVPGAGTVFARPGVTVSVAVVALTGVIQIFIYPLFYCVLTVALLRSPGAKRGLRPRSPCVHPPHRLIAP